LQTDRQKLRPAGSQDPPTRPATLAATRTALQMELGPISAILCWVHWWFTWQLGIRGWLARWHA